MPNLAAQDFLSKEDGSGELLGMLNLDLLFPRALALPDHDHSLHHDPCFLN
jgi:hypothetical protein